MTKFTIKDIVEGLNEALNLLSVAGPNPLLIESEDYFNRLSTLQEKFIESEESK